MAAQAGWFRSTRALALGVAALVGGCGGGGGSTPPPPPVVTVTVTPATATLKLDTAQQLAASVDGAANPAVRWSVAGAGCNGSACGTVDAGGLYSAPSVVPVPSDVTVTATSVEDPSRSATATLTIASDVVLGLWPAAARVTLGGQRQFLSMLTGHANTAVRWRVSGAGCSGAGCGSVVGDGVYQAPASLPPSTQLTLTATSVVDPNRSASAVLTLQALDAQQLSGSYAFFHRGVWGDSDSLMAGRFTSAGDGTLAAGVLDRSHQTLIAGQPVAQDVALAFTGDYAIAANQRGFLNLRLPSGPEQFSTVFPASGDNFFMQPFFATTVRGTTFAMKQDPAAFNTAAVAGSYVFQWTGATDTGTRIAQIGRFTADGRGGIGDGVLETNDGGGTLVRESFTGSYGVGAGGRGTLHLDMAGGSGFNFAVYVVTGDTLIVHATDTPGPGTPLRNGLALRQSGPPFDNTALQGNHVFDLAGRRSATSAVATVGRLMADGLGGIVGEFDRNDHYAIDAGRATTGASTVEAGGRGTLRSSSLPDLVFYLVSRNKALLLEATGSSVQTGTLERQADAPYATDRLRGSFVGVSSFPVLQTALTVLGTTHYDGAGSVDSLMDITTPCGFFGNATAFAGWSVAPSGRIDVRDSAGVQHAGGYLIDPVRYVMVLQRASNSATCDEVVHFVTAQQ